MDSSSDGESLAPLFNRASEDDRSDRDSLPPLSDRPLVDSASNDEAPLFNKASMDSIDSSAYHELLCLDSNTRHQDKCSDGEVEPRPGDESDNSSSLPGLDRRPLVDSSSDDDSSLSPLFHRSGVTRRPLVHSSSDDSSSLPPLFHRSGVDSSSDDESLPPLINRASMDASSDHDSLPPLSDRTLVDSAADDEAPFFLFLNRASRDDSSDHSSLPHLSDRQLVDSNADGEAPLFNKASMHSMGSSAYHELLCADSNRTHQDKCSDDEVEPRPEDESNNSSSHPRLDNKPLVDSSSDDDIGLPYSRPKVDSDERSSLPGLDNRPLVDSSSDELTALSIKQSNKFHTNWTPNGLQNLGNTCFVNAILQSIGYLTPLTKSILSYVPGTAPTDNSNSIAVGLQSVIKSLHSPSATSISPTEFISVLPSFGESLIHENEPKFRLGREEDAHEFLMAVFDQLNSKSTPSL